MKIERIAPVDPTPLAVPAELCARFPEGARILVGPGPYALGLVWADRLWNPYVAMLQGGEPARRLESLPATGELIDRIAFFPDGERIVVGGSMLVRTVDLAADEAQLVLAWGGTNLAVPVRFDDGWRILVSQALTTWQVTEDEPDSLALAERLGFEVGQVLTSREGLFVVDPVSGETANAMRQGTIDAAEVHRGGRLIVLRRTRYHHSFANRPWQTALATPTGDGLQVLGYLAGDIGPSQDDGDTLTGARGFRITEIDLQDVQGPLDRNANGRVRHAPSWPLAEHVVLPGPLAEQVVPRRDRPQTWVNRSSTVSHRLPSRLLGDFGRQAHWEAGEKAEMVPLKLRHLRRKVFQELQPRVIPPTRSRLETMAAAVAMTSAGYPGDRLVPFLQWLAQNTPPRFVVQVCVRTLDWRRCDLDLPTEACLLLAIDKPTDSMTTPYEENHPFFHERSTTDPYLPPYLVLREALALADEEAYTAARETAAAARARAKLPLRIVLALLFPETHWADHEAQAVFDLSPGRHTALARLATPLVAAVSQPELARRLVAETQLPIKSLAVHSAEVAVAFGAEATPVLGAMADRILAEGNRFYIPRELVDTLSAFDTPEAALALTRFFPFDSLRTELKEYFRRRAPRSLGALATYRKGKGAKFARELFQTLAKRHPEAAAEAQARAKSKPKSAKNGASEPRAKARPPESGEARTGERPANPFQGLTHLARKLVWAPGQHRRARLARGEPDLPPAPNAEDPEALRAEIAGVFKTYSTLFAAGTEMLDSADDGWFVRQKAVWNEGSPLDAAAAGDALEIFDHVVDPAELCVAGQVVLIVLSEGGPELLLQTLLHAWTRRQIAKTNYTNLVTSAIALADWPDAPAGTLCSSVYMDSYPYNRSFHLRIRHWDALRRALRHASDACYDSCLAAARPRFEAGSLDLRAALAYTFDETDWCDAIIEQCLALEDGQLPDFGHHLFALARREDQLTALLAAAERTRYGSYGSSPWHQAYTHSASMIYNLGARALPTLMSLVEECADSTLPWDELRQQVYQDIAAVQDPAAFGLLAEITTIGRPECWELVAGYARRSDGSSVVRALASRGEALPRPLIPVVALGLSWRHREWRTAIETLASGKLRDRLLALADALDPGAGPADPPPKPLRARNRKLHDATKTRQFTDPDLLPLPLLAESRQQLPADSLPKLMAALKKVKDPRKRSTAEAILALLEPASASAFGEALGEAWQNAGSYKTGRWVVDAAPFLGAPPITKARSRKKRERTWWPE
jgi:hypothetical protein